MEKIASFTIDHNRLERGIFVSRRDVTPSGDVITTFDIRMTRPNREPAADGAALHTIEHLAATYLRNNHQWRDRVIYWGPMGCRTGNYLLLAGDHTPADILPLMRDTFGFIAEFDGEIPGATARDCGNYTYNDLPEARRMARRYLDEVLAQPQPCNLNYPAD
ncbi:MAG: S-ribosylhomocysteine lyase [Muribaculaceae bacterium]|nr:S-ribosylhomocysteine lyase [Muribaculaceae bacterium]